MALGMEWRDVECRLDALSKHEGLLPTIDAMRRVLVLLKDDPALAGAQRGVSHASLRLGYPAWLSFVIVGWTEQEGYGVSLWEPDGDMRSQTVKDENDVPSAVHRYLRQIRTVSEPQG